MIGVAAAVCRRRRKRLQALLKPDTDTEDCALGNDRKCVDAVCNSSELSVRSQSSRVAASLRGLRTSSKQSTLLPSSVSAPSRRLSSHNGEHPNPPSGMVLNASGLSSAGACASTGSRSIRGYPQPQLVVSILDAAGQSALPSAPVIHVPCSSCTPASAVTANGTSSSIQMNTSLQHHAFSPGKAQHTAAPLGNSRLTLQPDPPIDTVWDSTNSSCSRAAMTNRAAGTHAPAENQHTYGSPGKASGCCARGQQSVPEAHQSDAVYERARSGLGGYGLVDDDSAFSAPGLLRPRSGAAVLRDLKLGPLLGGGSFGKVYKGRWKGAPVAVKVIEHHGCASNGESAKTELRPAGNVGDEALVATSMAHPNVVQTYQIATLNADQHTRFASSHSGECAGRDGSVNKFGPQEWASDGDSNNGSEQEGHHQETWIIMEYCELGTLEQAISRGRFMAQEGKPELMFIYKALIDTVAGLDYLHSMGVVHGDLKPANVLLKCTTRDFRGFCCKITDFGLSRVLGANATHISTKNHGTLDYMPAELLQDGVLTTATDIYSLGIIMWELYTGTRVFEEAICLAEMYCLVVLQGWRPEVSDSMPADYAALMQSCWHADPQQRPTACKLLRTLQKLYATAKKGAMAPAQQQVVGLSAKPSASTDFVTSDQGSRAGSGFQGVATHSNGRDANGRTGNRVSAIRPAVYANCSDSHLLNSITPPTSTFGTVGSGALVNGGACEPLGASQTCSNTVQPAWNQRTLPEPQDNSFVSDISNNLPTQIATCCSEPFNLESSELWRSWNRSSSGACNHTSYSNSGNAVLRTSGSVLNSHTTDHDAATREYLQALELVSRPSVTTGSGNGLGISATASAAAAGNSLAQGGPLTVALKPWLSGPYIGYWESGVPALTAPPPCTTTDPAAETVGRSGSA